MLILGGTNFSYKSLNVCGAFLLMNHYLEDLATQHARFIEKFWFFEILILAKKVVI